jgi:hypothetical protein
MTAWAVMASRTACPHPAAFAAALLELGDTMSVVHILNHGDLGQLHIEDPLIVIDSEGEHEHYVMIVHDGIERTPYSVHVSKTDAEEAAATLAKRLHCEFFRPARPEP